MKKILIIGILAGLIVFFAGVRMHIRVMAQDQENEETTISTDSEVDEIGTGESQSEELVLFVQEGCSHCAKVEAFIEDNNLGESVLIKDMTQEPSASTEFTEFLDEQDVPLQERGVPLLVYGDSDWVSGDTPIIDYLSERFGIEEKGNEYSASDYAILGVAVVIIVGVVGYAIVNTSNARKS